MHPLCLSSRKISGVVIGSLVLGVINNGLNILNIPTFYQQIVLGSLIIIAVTLDRMFSAKKQRVVMGNEL